VVLLVICDMCPGMVDRKISGRIDRWMNGFKVFAIILWRYLKLCVRARLPNRLFSYNFPCNRSWMWTLEWANNNVCKIMTLK